MLARDSDRVAVIAAALAAGHLVLFTRLGLTSPYLLDRTNGDKWMLGLIGVSLASSIIGGWLVRQARSGLRAALIGAAAVPVAVVIYAAVVGYGLPIQDARYVLSMLWWLLLPLGAATALVLRAAQRFDRLAPTQLDALRERVERIPHKLAGLVFAFCLAFLIVGALTALHIARCYDRLDDMILDSAVLNQRATPADFPLLRRQISHRHEWTWNQPRVYAQWTLFGDSPWCGTEVTVFSWDDYLH